jgi:predicted DNA repair protein MutK
MDKIGLINRHRQVASLLALIVLGAVGMIVHIDAISLWMREKK